MGYLEESGSKDLTPSTYPGDRFHQQLMLSGALGYGPKEDLPLRAYLMVLFRHRYVVVGCVLLGIAFSAFANYLSVPAYSSTSVVNIGSYVPPLDGPMAAMLRDETRKTEYVKNQIAMLESNTIANLVLSDNPDILEFLGYGEYVTTPTFSKKKGSSTEVDLIANLGDDQRIYDIPVNALESYLNHISYTKVYETSMVKITANAGTPDMAAKMANAHANAFIVLVRQQRLRAANVNLKFLEKNAQKSAEKTSAAEHELVDYALKHSINAGEGITDAQHSVNLESLKRNLADSVLMLAGAEAELRETRNGSGGAGSLEYNPALHQQYLDLAEIEGEMEQIKKINRNHPAIKILKKQADTLRQTLQGYSLRQTKDLETAVKVAQQKKRLLERELEQAQHKNLEQSQAAVEYNLLERNHKAAKDNHIQVTQRLEDAIVNAENDQKTVILVDPALPPTSPSNIGDTVTLWHGLFLGLLGGLALTVLLNILDNKIRTVGDVQSALNVPVLGVVPAFSRGRMGISIPTPKDTQVTRPSDDTMIASRVPAPMNGSGTFMNGDSETGLYPVHGGYGETQQMPAAMSGSATGMMSTQDHMVSKSVVQSAYAEHGPNEETEILDRSIVLVSAPFSTESEAFRTVLTTLTYSSETEVPKVIFITSGQQGEGKSTVATNLAVALAEMSGSTLLIDADLRLPTIHKHFNRPRLTPGLADYLCGQREYNEVLCRGYVNNLSVLFAGNPVVTPGMLLQSKKMSELLELLSDEFDHIIIDGPPLAHVADSLLLSRLADGVVLVVRSGKTSKPVAQSAMQHLQQVRANVLGTVLNGVARSRASKQSDYYYVVDNYPRV